MVEYDGSGLHGWQCQPRLRTGQGVFEDAVRKMAKQKINVTASGRTDTGVHAEGQVVNFAIDRDWKPEVVLRGLNSLLPEDIRIRSCRVVPDGFNARYDAVSREYRYRIYGERSALRRRTHWCTDLQIDYGVLETLAKRLCGSHDFRSFCVKKSQKESNVCVVTKSFWTKRGKEYTFHVVANRFLHGMVRSLVGTMVKVASSQLTERDFELLFERPERSAKVLTAPPQGLTLVKVNYR